MLKTLVTVALLASGSVASAANHPATHHAIHYEGRVSKNYADGSVRFNWPGSQLHTKLTGRAFHIELMGYGDQFDVLIDGKFTKKLKTNANGVAETFTLFESAKAETVTIELVKRWEHYEHNTQILSVDVEGKLDSIQQPQPHILFIGDSISAGFGSESTQRQCEWSEILDLSNARKAFPYMSAQQLGASFTQVSYSGLGLIRNWGGNQPHHTLRSYFDKMSAVFTDNTDFEDKFPELIVIEVGTNDFSTDPTPAEPWQTIDEVKTQWVETMVVFTKQLRARYPAVPIIYMPRPAYPYNFIIPATHDAIARLNQQDITKLYSHTFDSPLEGCVWHPTASEHQDIAEKLVTFIKQQTLL